MEAEQFLPISTKDTPMPAKRLTPLLLGSSLAATSTVALALGLGDATPRSALGEPLQLNIPVSIGPGEEVGEHCFALRPAPFNQATGLPAITQGSVSVMRSAAGKAILRVSTSVPVDEPMIALGIETRCKINVARDYSIFLSPRGDDGSTTLAADAVWDVPAALPAVAVETDDTPVAVLATNEPHTNPHEAASLAPASLTAAKPAVAAAAEPRPVAPARVAAAAIPAAPAGGARPAITKTAPAPAAKPATFVAATTTPAAAAPSAAKPQHLAAPAQMPSRAAAPMPLPGRQIATERDAQLAELNETVNALRAQVAAQEKRLQELTAQQPAAPLRVVGQYRPDSVIPATLNVPIARNDAQTVVYRATPVAVPQPSGVSLPTLGIALLVTALAAAGSGHYMGRRAAEGNAGRRGTRTTRRPTRRPRD